MAVDKISKSQNINDVDFTVVPSLTGTGNIAYLKRGNTVQVFIISVGLSISSADWVTLAVLPEQCRPDILIQGFVGYGNFGGTTLTIRVKTDGYLQLGTSVLSLTGIWGGITFVVT